MPTVEERVDKLEETIQRLADLIAISIQEQRQMLAEWDRKLDRERQERERMHREWLERFEREKQEREEQRKKDWEEWNRKLEEEKRQREEERKKDWEEWSKKLEEERKQREEERKRDWEEWNRKFEQQKREDRKKWEEMVMRLGTIVEDIVAPSIETVAKKYFGCVDVEFDGIRVKKRNTKDRGRIKEFDFILVCDNIILVNETKANPRPEYAKDFVEFIKSGEFWDYFPEYRDKKLIPVFSTLYMPEDVVTFLTKNKIYALAMKGDEMDIINYYQINQGGE